jgi:hypothetical protein
MKFNVIEKEFPKNTFNCPYCGYILVGLFAIVNILYSLNLKYPNDLLETIGLLIGVAFVGTLIFFYIVSIGKKAKIITVGSVKLMPDALEVVHKDETLQIPYPELKKIRLRYTGYKGVILFAIRPSLIPEDGLGNILTFTFNGNDYRYEIFLENKRQKDALFKIIKRLRGRVGRL